LSEEPQAGAEAEDDGEVEEVAVAVVRATLLESASADVDLDG
jgi:hypothetical protein